MANSQWIDCFLVGLLLLAIWLLKRSSPAKRVWVCETFKNRVPWVTGEPWLVLPLDTGLFLVEREKRETPMIILGVSPREMRWEGRDQLDKSGSALCVG